MYMSQIKKLFLKIFDEKQQNNISFLELRKLLTYIGFSERIKGSHHIFYKNDVQEIINLQPLRGKKAKNYQVKQVREIVIFYKLDIENT